MLKIIGIPQNRERVFIVSIRKDIDKGTFYFPQKEELLWKLKDFLEINVDSKYYLTEKGVGRLIRKDNKLIRELKNPTVSACIIANYHKLGGRDQQYILKNKVKRVTGLYDTDKSKHQTGSIYDINGISPTLTDMSRGGLKQPLVLINEGTSKGYTEASIGDSINISYSYNINKRGRVGKAISNTITTSPNMATIDFINDNYAIRKLTPLECWKLMGFSMNDFYNAKSVKISDTQLYRQARK